MDNGKAVDQSTQQEIAAPCASPCMECGNPFTPAKSWQKFCTDSCRDGYHLRRRRGEEEPHTLAGVAAPRNNKQATGAKPTSIRPGTKLAAVLSALAEGQTLNRFEAERVARYWLADDQRAAAKRLLGHE